MLFQVNQGNYPDKDAGPDAIAAKSPLQRTITFTDQVLVH